MAFLSKSYDKTIFSLVFLNIVVYLLWKVKRAKRFMTRYFLPDVSEHPISFVLSVLFHQSFLHLVFDLWSLVTYAMVTVDLWHYQEFLCVYFCGGAVATWTSITCRRWLDVGSCGGLPGATSAIRAVMSYLCGSHPHTEYMPERLPDFTYNYLPFMEELYDDSTITVPWLNVQIPVAFSVCVAMATIFVFDSLGLMLDRSNTLDHGAHLAGIVCGWVMGRNLRFRGLFHPPIY